jgi:hypothetical protein
MMKAMASGLSALERIVKPARGGFSRELAEYVVQLDFSPKDHARYERLSAKAQAGTLTRAERMVLDDLLAAADVLAILHSKARMSLKRRNSAA